MATRVMSPPSTADLTVSPTAEEIARFRQDGFLSVERITTDEEIAWLRSIFELVFSDEEADAAGAPLDRSRPLDSGEPGRLRQAFFPEVRFPEILASTFHRNARRYAAALLGVEEGALTSWSHMIEKPQGDGSPVAWHQDEAYWEPELEYHALAAWLPLHEVTVDMGCMQFIPGSHLRGIVPHRHDADPRENKLAAIDVDDSTAVPCPLPLGGVTFHHARTLHHTAPNVTDRRRMALPSEFQVAPVRRAVPTDHAWWRERRAFISAPDEISYLADGTRVRV
jgi:ectoine hydroxylase-related dioxygenase (phytanoyl-CoA dioxygenase family)